MKTNAQIFAAAITLVAMTAPGLAETVGVASYYGKELSGRRTANGERFNPYGMTAAHRSYAFGTKLRVTNLRNGRAVVVRISDRGPFVRGRVLDLSLGAAKSIGMIGTGTAKVRFAKL
jgi:rare lipoprotein A